MSNMQQPDDSPQPDTRVGFQVPEEFKRELDIEVARRGTTIKALLISLIAKELGIPVPGEDAEQRRKKAS